MNILYIGAIATILAVTYFSILQYIYILNKDMLDTFPNKVNSLNFIDDSRINKSFYLY